MPRQVLLFDQPERFVAGTVGQPGERQFFLQARDGARVVSVALEKAQVQVLAERVDALLDEVVRRTGGRGPGPGHRAARAATTSTRSTPPVTEEFRVGAMALGWNGDSELRDHRGARGPRGRRGAEVPDLEEDPDDGPTVLRVRLTGAAGPRVRQARRCRSWPPAGRRARSATSRSSRRATSARAPTATGAEPRRAMADHDDLLEVLAQRRRSRSRAGSSTPATPPCSRSRDARRRRDRLRLQADRGGAPAVGLPRRARSACARSRPTRCPRRSAGTSSRRRSGARTARSARAWRRRGSTRRRRRRDGARRRARRRRRRAGRTPDGLARGARRRTATAADPVTLVHADDADLRRDVRVRLGGRTTPTARAATSCTGGCSPTPSRRRTASTTA